MPNVGGQETKKEPQNKSNNQSSSKATGNGESKKKKRPRNRIRHRTRNKSNKIQDPNILTTTAIATDDKQAAVPTTLSPIPVQSVVTTSQPHTVVNESPVIKSPTHSPKHKIVHNTNKNASLKQELNSTATPMKHLTPNKPQSAASVPEAVATAVNLGKTREQIMAERGAKKLAKQVKKVKTAVHDKDSAAANIPTLAPNNITPNVSVQMSQVAAVNSKTKQPVANTISEVAAVKDNKVPVTNESSSAPVAGEKTREQIKAEREAKKQAKHASKSVKNVAEGITAMDQQFANIKLVETVSQVDATTPPAAASQSAPVEKKKPALTKAERRAIQEAQRTAKVQSQNNITAAKATAPVGVAKPVKPAAVNKDKSPSPSAAASSPTKTLQTKDCKVKLFNHLEIARQDVSLFMNNPQIHPAIARLGEQYAKRTVVGSNARCIAFLNALKMVIQDFETPPKKEFGRSLEASFKHCVNHLQQCRPLAVSVSNAYKHIKHVLTQMPMDHPETELKENLCHFIETYIENQIGKAAQAISSSMQEKISNGDVILTFGCSSLISYICEEAHRRHVDFRVVVVDSRPFCEGQELLRRLTAKEIPCTYVLINAVGFVMPEVTKVLLGAHALLSNGYVMARAGTAQVALVARSFNVPVLVCCETHKFSERFQTDAIVYNELGNPDDLVMSDKCCLTNWQVKGKMTPLNLIYDVTPPELVTAVVTEVSILPCTSVPVILRIKPTEIGYYS